MTVLKTPAILTEKRKLSHNKFSSESYNKKIVKATKVVLSGKRKKDKNNAKLFYIGIASSVDSKF